MRRARRHGSRPTPALAVAASALALGAAIAVAAGCARTPRRTEIVFWQSRPAAAIAPLLRQFEAEHPGFAVRMRQLSPPELADSLDAALLSGRVPDLCECPSHIMPRLVAGSLLADWSAGVADLRDSVRGWPLCSLGETLYGLPWVLEPRMLFFNRSLFARAGLDSERGPETWADLAHDAASIQRLAQRSHLAGVHGLGLGAAGSGRLFEDFMPLAWGAGGAILSADLDSARFDSPENRGALTFALKLRHSVLAADDAVLDQEFRAGRLGLLCESAALAGRIAPGTLSFGVVRIPKPEAEDGRHASTARGGVLASFRASRQKEMALRLARFLVEPDRALEATSGGTGMLPASIGSAGALAQQAAPLERPMILQLDDLHFAPNHADWDSMRIAIEDGLAQAWADSAAPPESAAARATAAVDRRLVQLLSRR
jgi:ABC-type glycerol-3-phosphate transport system substrate-binding protein